MWKLSTKLSYLQSVANPYSFYFLVIRCDYFTDRIIVRQRYDTHSDFADRLEIAMNDKAIKHSPTVLAHSKKLDAWKMFAYAKQANPSCKVTWFNCWVSSLWKTCWKNICNQWVWWQWNCIDKHSTTIFKTLLATYKSTATNCEWNGWWVKEFNLILLCKRFLSTFGCFLVC